MRRMARHTSRLIYNNNVFILIKNIRFAGKPYSMRNIFFHKDEMDDVTCMDSLSDPAWCII